MIDDYDIDLSIGSDTSVNSRENCNIYFTKKEDNVFLLEAVICDKDFSVETIFVLTRRKKNNSFFFFHFSHVSKKNEFI